MSDAVKIADENRSALQRIGAANLLLRDALTNAENERAEAIRIARAIAKIASSNDAPAIGSIGTLVAELDALEERIARGRDFDQATGGVSE